MEAKLFEFNAGRFDWWNIELQPDPLSHDQGFVPDLRHFSFQAVKHLCADMLVRAELARVAVEAAGVVCDQPHGEDPGRFVAVAKCVADDAAVRNVRSCVQVHGGMGFTWEADPHLFLKRAWSLAQSFGTADRHAEAVAAAL